MAGEITVIGGGFAGVEAAWAAAQRGSKVTLYEMRPERRTPVHSTGDLAELVCSNSFKSNLLTNASGVLKEEMRRLGSLVLPIAEGHRVPAGEALAVDREPFAREITETLEGHPNITIVRQEVTSLPAARPLIIATGPLTSDALAAEIAKLTGGDSLSFYDAVAPTVTYDSLDMTKIFRASRRGKGDPGPRDTAISLQSEGDTSNASADGAAGAETAGEDDVVGCGGAPTDSADYLNCPFNKDDYLAFWKELTEAELAPLHDFEEGDSPQKMVFFEMCVPIEELARRGPRTLSFGAMKPIGLTDPRTGRRPWACVQLRQENKEGTLWGLVGFQTRLKWGEQKRILRMIPGLENAEFVRYGVMHRNTYVNAPRSARSELPAARASRHLPCRADDRGRGLSGIGRYRHPDRPERAQTLPGAGQRRAAEGDRPRVTVPLPGRKRPETLRADELQLGRCPGASRPACARQARKGTPEGRARPRGHGRISRWPYGPRLLRFRRGACLGFGIGRKRAGRSVRPAHAMNLADLHARRRPGRAITGMAAALLPFTESGAIAEDAFAACLLEIVSAGLTPAVNMDTGYVNLLTDAEKTHVLQLARQVLAGAPFLAGAYTEGQGGDVASLYRREIARIAEYGGTPILFQTARLHDRPAGDVAAIYAVAVADVPRAYAFELGRMFAPNGEIWSSEVAEAIMAIPQFQGMKHSSLDRMIELERLVLRDKVRPDFRILTGNDLGIDMIEYGSDYLLGLAAFCPRKFAERDRLWRKGSPDYLATSDALQLLGNIAFRPPVPAYKHSAAIFLHLLGKIPTARTHPRSPERPPWEREILASCAGRLGLL